MSESTTTSNKRTPVDAYALVTGRIIEQLEKGIVPWLMPWTSAGLPTNLITKKPFTGINTMLLASLGYEQNLFLTYNQANKVGGKIKRDEAGHPVVYWNTTEQNGASTDAKKIGSLLSYTVFNIAQCENIPEDYLPVKEEEESKPNPVPICEYIFANMPKCPEIRHKENKAFYNALYDFLNMPKLKNFANIEDYYSLLLHQLVHSTGHYSRIGRKDLLLMSEFGADAFSQEELVAEIGTAYLQSYAGIVTDFQQSTAYIQGWLWKLKNDKKFIFSAASAAQKAVDYILGAIQETENQQSEEE